MNSYRLSDKVDKNKIFLSRKSEIEKRLDPFYYIPEIVEIENKVLLKRPQKLIHYVKSISSGATPKTTEIEKYYSNKENGIPFLRVQNITEEGIILHNCKYINTETHNGLLKRSQVKGGNLIATITGRIASASVAPIGFDGNINQHSVVIQTEGFKVSQILAAFLNSTIGKKLAWRRVTGGTRPALDYPTLLSIPVIYDKQILEITKKAVKKKQTKEKQAKNLLTSIDDYLLGELGIKLPEQDKSLYNRMFLLNFSSSIVSRWDSFYHQKYFTETTSSFESGKYNFGKLSNVIKTHLIKGRLPKNEEKEGPCKVIQINSINSDGTIDIDKLLTSKNIYTKEQKLFQDDILVVITGATIGKIAFWNLARDYFLGGDIVKFQTKPNANPYYVYNYLLSTPAQIQIKRNITGATNGHLAPYDIKNMLIPLPPVEKQNEIAEHIHQIRERAKQLQQEAQHELANAKKEVEKMILGE